MPFIVAVAGKGGVGKSTLAALLVRELAKRSGQIILAVDADPNSNLGEKLGTKVERTIGDLREDLLKNADEVAAGGSKQDAVLYHLRLAMVEGREFDLVTMGRPEGRGCYCYINNLLRTFLDDIMGGYPYVVIDNEAGMEHLSRRTCQRMDALLVVSDATKVGLDTAGRILALAKDMELDVRSAILVVNRVKGEAGEDLKAMLPPGFQSIVFLPYDAEVEELTASGRPLSSLGGNNKFGQAVGELAASLN